LPSWLAPAEGRGQRAAWLAWFSPIRAALSGWVRGNRLWFVGGGVMGGVLLLLAAWFWFGGPSGSADEQTRVAVSGQSPLTREPAVKSQPAPVEARIPQKTASQATTRPRVLIVVPREGFWIGDYRPVRERLAQANVEVRVASSAPGSAGGRNNFGGPDILQQPVDVTVADAAGQIDQFNAVYFVGKPPPQSAGRNEFARGGEHAESAGRLIRAALDRGKIVSSLCRGTIVLFDAGVLENREAARGNYLKDLPPEGGVRWRRGEAVVRDGQLLTGADPDDAEEFSARLLELLEGDDP
jgi:putative intracellular protease/amidase